MKLTGILKKSVEHFQGRFFTRVKTKLGRASFGIVGPGGGGGEIPPPPLNAENIKAMITKLKGQLERLKVFPLRSTTLADDVT